MPLNTIVPHSVSRIDFVAEIRKELGKGLRRDMWSRNSVLVMTCYHPWRAYTAQVSFRRKLLQFSRCFKPASLHV